MNLKRRTFIGQASVGVIALAAAKPVRAASFLNIPDNGTRNDLITIYHTNDLNGKIYPVTSGAGLKQVKACIQKERRPGLVFDGGNFLSRENSDTQNLSVIALMNTMGYLAATPGKSELSLGQDALAKLIPAMNFDLVNCNYTFGSALSGKIHRYTIKQYGGLKIGITGVGPKLKGLGFSDPVESANATAAMLKSKEKCDLIICLSQLGLSKDKPTNDSRRLAKLSQHIDFIISGNGKNMAGDPMIILNKNKQEVFVSQLAPDGAMFGRTRLGFDDNNQRKSIHIKNVAV